MSSTFVVPEITRASRPKEPSAQQAKQTATMRRRLWVSAKWPAKSASRAAGRNEARPEMPSASALLVTA